MSTDHPPESAEVAVQPYRAAHAKVVRELAADADVPLGLVAPELAEADQLEADHG